MHDPDVHDTTQHAMSDATHDTQPDVNDHVNRDAKDDIAHDAALVARLRSGDGTALAGLMTRYHAELFAYLVRWTRDTTLATDVLQDVLFHLWRTRETVALPHGIRAHLYIASRSRALDVMRAERRADARARVFLNTQEHSVFREDENATKLDRDTIAAAVQNAVERLPAGAREVWRLCREQGLSYAETAAVLGVSVGTVKTQMSRAFKAIRTVVGPLLSLALLVVR